MNYFNLTLRVLLQIIIITVTTHIFCNEGKSVIDLQSRPNAANIYSNSLWNFGRSYRKKNQILTPPQLPPGLISVHTKKSQNFLLYNNEKEKEKVNNDKTTEKNNWIPRYLLKQQSQQAAADSRQASLPKSGVDASTTTEVKCLMDVFRPEQFNWNTFRNTGSDVDLSHMSIYEENEILHKLHNIKFLDSITALTLAENNLTSIPFESLSLVQDSLLYLDLEGNNFFVTYRMMTHKNQGANTSMSWARFPKMLKLEVLNLAHCNIQFINEEMFVNVTNLLSLNLAYNNIVKIPANSFANVPHLVHLDMASMNSYLRYDAPSYETYIALMEGGGLTIDEFAFQNLTELEYINLSRTRVSPKTKAFHHFGSALRYLGLCSATIQMLDNKIFTKRTIEVLDISGNPYVVHSLNDNSFKGLEDSLKILWVAESAITKLIWLKKLQSIQYLNLAENNINAITNETFSSMRNLVYLDLSGNHIGNWYYQSFGDNHLLKILSFKENNINMITEEMYKDFSKMDFLALSKNNFVCACYLRTLIEDAKSNGRFNKNFINYLHHQNGTEIFHNWMKRVLIEQYYKEYVESQENLQGAKPADVKTYTPSKHDEQPHHFQLLDYNDEDYWCYSGSTYLKLNDVSFCKHIEAAEELNETAKFIICGFVVFVVVSSLFAFAYFKKNKIKQLIHKIKKYFGIMSGKDMLSYEQNYKYDVFISYSDRDREWILEELIPNMDSDKELKICLHEREFKVGLTIWENIIHHMDKSRSLLLVVSNHFLSSNWCQFEMQFAQKRLFETKRNQLVLILLEEIPNSSRPRALQYLMDLRTYIKWPQMTGNETKDIELKQTFWNRIKKSLKND